MMFPFPGWTGACKHIRGAAPALCLSNRPARPCPFQPNRPEVLVMKWETPQAIDFRFGMEITMYIANR